LTNKQTITYKNIYNKKITFQKVISN